jgi:hypothetical protein
MVTYYRIEVCPCYTEIIIKNEASSLTAGKVKWTCGPIWSSSSDVKLVADIGI